MNKRFPLKQVAATGEVQGGRQRSPHMTEGRIVPYLRVANVFDGYIDFDDINKMPFRANEIEIFRLKPGDILLNEGQSVELVGRCAMYVNGPEDCCFQNTLIRYRAGSATEADFALQLFRYCQATGIFSRIAVKTNSIAHLGVSRFAELELPFPPLPEQRKIAEILRTWDNAIAKLEALRAAKAQQIEGFATRLIHNAQAEQQHLREHLNEVSERNKGQGVNRILSVTNSTGFVLAEDQFAHRVASADISNYKIVRRGQYAYNPSRINVGSIARLDDWPEGALSPMYIVFAVRHTLDTDFFGHWLRSAEARKRIALAAQGSVRDTVSFGDLESIMIPFPSLDEQRRIARALTAAKHELALLDSEIETLTRQKRGLMQKLLTGEWRVQVEGINA